MRSTLVKRHRRSCPQCGCLGFARTGTDYFGAATFECNDCRHEWAAERGPQRGTSLDRPRHQENDHASE
jgi:hypothetical protein